MSSRITIVSGLPRCGTSMMMKMLEAGGLEPVTDRERKADVDNPLGYYEFELVKRIAEDASWLPDVQGKAVKMVSALLKHLPQEFEYDILLMKRDMDEMLASQAKMLERLGTGGQPVDDQVLANLFEKQMQEVEQWVVTQPNMRSLAVRYNDVVTDADGQTRRIASFLDVPLDSEAMAGIVAPDLHRNRGS